MDLLISGYGKAPQTSIALYNEKGQSMWTDGIEAPSFLARGDGYVFAVTENETWAAVYAYREEADGLCLTDARRFDGGLLCHIAYSPKNRMLLGACYETGTVFSAAFDPACGCFGELRLLEQKGNGKSRAHCVLLNAAEDHVLSANIALDRIFCYRLDGEGLEACGSFAVKPGSGPRHLLWSADESRLYAITEYSNEILVFDAADFSLLQTVSTLPQGHVGESHCSTLCFSADQRILYAANRFADTIAVFDVDETGRLTLRTAFDCGGRNPRHMALSPDGRCMAVCCQDSDEAVLFGLNERTGLPEGILYRLPFVHPAGIQWRA